MNTLILLITLWLPDGNIGILTVPTADCNAAFTAAYQNEDFVRDLGRATHMDVQCLEAEGKPARDA